MAIKLFKDTLVKSVLVIATFILLPLSMAASSAEEEFSLLIFEANLIAEIEGQQADLSPERIISSYYSLLDEDAAARVNLHRRELKSLNPRYEVAYKAADSAELAELMDEISFHWGAIKSIHSKYFIRSVQLLLSTAYDQELAEILSSPIPK
jgi:hypothetical protein